MRSLILTAALSLLWISNCEAASKKPEALVAIVYFYGFNSESYADIGPNKIESVGCRFTIKQTKFDELIRLALPAEAFYPGRIRAKVVLKNNTAYLFDHSGVFQHGDQLKSIDKAKFEKALVPMGSKHCG